MPTAPTSRSRWSSFPAARVSFSWIFGTVSSAATTISCWFSARHATGQRLAFTSACAGSAAGYRTVADALGDFVLLTPLTGSGDIPDWRFVVAHGHPACGPGSRPSRFDLDLLRPTDDPTHPAVDWHFEHAYRQDRSVVPRLITTEDHDRVSSDGSSTGGERTGEDSGGGPSYQPGDLSVQTHVFWPNRAGAGAGH